MKPETRYEASPSRRAGERLGTPCPGSSINPNARVAPLFIVTAIVAPIAFLECAQEIARELATLLPYSSLAFRAWVRVLPAYAQVGQRDCAAVPSPIPSEIPKAARLVVYLIFPNSSGTHLPAIVSLSLKELL